MERHDPPERRHPSRVRIEAGHPDRDVYLGHAHVQIDVRTRARQASALAEQSRREARAGFVTDRAAEGHRLEQPPAQVRDEHVEETLQRTRRLLA
jgi:hypothetical protein